jgi:hypothetical protein
LLVASLLAKFSGTRHLNVCDRLYTGTGGDSFLTSGDYKHFSLEELADEKKGEEQLTF